MEKKDKVPYVIGGLIVAFIIGVSMYVYFRINAPEFPLKRYILIFGAIILGISVIVFALYKILNWHQQREPIDVSSPKEYVSTTRARDILKEEIIKGNEITYMECPWEKEPKIKPVNRYAVEFGDTWTPTDPTMQTSDRFHLCEVIVREGRRTGMIYACIRIDLGEEYIRNNWSEGIKWNASMATHTPPFRSLPMSSAQALNERLAIKRMEMQEEGFSDEFIDEMIRPFMSNPTPQMPPQTRKSPRKVEDVRQAFPEYKDNEDDEIDVDDIQDEIERIREENRVE